VWAPNARWVSVVGDFNDWSRSANPMRWDDTGIWQVFVPGAKDGQHYKYIVISHHGWEQWKIDPVRIFRRGSAAHCVHRVAARQLRMD
jgi:1,4-alpha-glucan branching enzyme